MKKRAHTHTHTHTNARTRTRVFIAGGGWPKHVHHAPHTRLNPFALAFSLLILLQFLPM
jgi:hypothetical protein